MRHNAQTEAEVRATRLKFKRRPERRHTEHEALPDSPPRPAEPPPPPKKQSDPEPRPHYEYGPSINGYRFVTPHPDQKPFPNVNYHRHINGYAAELPELPQKEDPYRVRRNDYEEYVKRWQTVDLEHELPPMPVPGGEVNLQSVGQFIPHDQLRVERIRWHPDKILRRVSEDRRPVLAEMVTRTFQVINELYENASK
ncbi:hypothetical protein KL930_002238 [Ogataea haglerorum]|uniref:Uncharacterized protein n=1 Tax=Ogataea haglerorum TaxID=1937702 RepID=A0ABQ7RLT4_9ASCO|nr:uncharacterized protein KL911_000157 [Ogataea haglerorum]KAG7698974.1 hypothetical protein KL915_001266 [Ogataea haglerorum]KAG7700578.1 hypothetical protein KL951_000693 [Ogataea haglerorum]KAG7710016.1 hypothetical protein KL914_000926 [Ogataea haglerorum]KAG7711202.1 hypothetical protein KL950_001168 [Ogataea haglerorum]KAG7740844.1 hypothetical protein KL923_001485 [Ogataea haglerorum]